MLVGVGVALGGTRPVGVFVAVGVAVGGGGSVLVGVFVGVRVDGTVGDSVGAVVWEGVAVGIEGAVTVRVGVDVVGAAGGGLLLSSHPAAKDSKTKAAAREALRMRVDVGTVIRKFLPIQAKRSESRPPLHGRVTVPWSKAK